MTAAGHRTDCGCVLCGRPSGIVALPMADTVRDLLAQERDAARLECDILRKRVAALETQLRATADPYPGQCDPAADEPIEGSEQK